MSPRLRGRWVMLCRPSDCKGTMKQSVSNHRELSGLSHALAQLSVLSASFLSSVLSYNHSLVFICYLFRYFIPSFIFLLCWAASLFLTRLFLFVFISRLFHFFHNSSVLIFSLFLFICLKISFSVLFVFVSLSHSCLFACHLLFSLRCFFLFCYYFVSLSSFIRLAVKEATFRMTLLLQAPVLVRICNETAGWSLKTKTTWQTTA
jgi:hypothetical protein